jgi:uncharacterized glyoxalase superfamily protein PhnB
MPERSLVDRVDDAVEAILRPPGSASLPEDPELAPLWRIAVDLVDLPAESFRARLEAEIRSRASMSTTPLDVSAQPAERHLPEGFHTLTPYLVVQGADALIAFMQRAFAAEERLRVKRRDGTIQHAEVRIGDSVVELGDAAGPSPPRPAAIHLYVEDADATYTRAMAAGATVLVAPTDMPYGDREADVRDPFGNNWYIGTRMEGGPVPAGLHTVNLTLHAKGTDRLIDFIKRAFGAAELDRVLAPDGTVIHAQLGLGKSVLELGEPRGFVSPMPTGIHLYVEDADAVYARALAAGATAVTPPADNPYGDRAATVLDPAGNHWFIATRLQRMPA